MLDRLVVAIGPGADEIGTRVFGLLSRDYWETACTWDLALRAYHDTKIMVIRTKDIHTLPRSCESMASNPAFEGRRVLAYGSDLRRPYGRWYASARFPVTIVEVGAPLNRFQALEKTAALLTLLGCHDPIIHDRVRESVDS
jgi:hypothetical protein